MKRSLVIALVGIGILMVAAAPPIQHQGQTQEALNWAAGRDSLGVLNAWLSAYDRAQTHEGTLASSSRDSIDTFGRYHAFSIAASESIGFEHYWPDGTAISSCVFPGQARFLSWAGDSLKWQTGSLAANVRVSLMAHTDFGLYGPWIPLTEMHSDSTYLGYTAGLYGNGRNAPPPAHLDSVLHYASLVEPLDAGGSPSPSGAGVVLVVGHSIPSSINRTGFLAAVAADPHRKPWIRFVNGCSTNLEAWHLADGGHARWNWITDSLTVSGYTWNQIVAVHMKTVLNDPTGRWSEAAYTDSLREAMEDACANIRTKAPNCKIVLLSSRISAAYAYPSDKSPEPYCYVGGFAVQDLIVDQIAGDAGLAYPDTSPILYWWDYDWTNGAQPRGDGFASLPEYYDRDRIHLVNKQPWVDEWFEYLQTDTVAGVWYRE